MSGRRGGRERGRGRQSASPHVERSEREEAWALDAGVNPVTESLPSTQGLLAPKGARPPA